MEVCQSWTQKNHVDIVHSSDCYLESMQLLTWDWKSCKWSSGCSMMFPFKHQRVDRQWQISNASVVMPPFIWLMSTYLKHDVWSTILYFTICHWQNDVLDASVVSLNCTVLGQTRLHCLSFLQSSDGSIGILGLEEWSEWWSHGSDE